MRRVWHWIRVLVVAALVVVVLAVAAVRFLLPADRLVRVAVTRVEAATGADVELGRISLRFWPRLHMLVEGGRVRLPAPVAGRRPLGGAVTWRRLAVALSWRGFLRRRVLIDRITLDGPVVTLITAGTGGRGGDPASRQPAMVALAAVAVRDGTLRWRDTASGRRVTLLGWRQEVHLSGPLLERLLAGGPPWPGRRRAGLRWRASADTLRWFAGTADSTGVTLAGPAMDLSLSLPPAGDRWQWRLAALSLPGVTLAGDGAWQPAPPGAGRLTGSWRLADWEPAVLPHLLGGLAAPRRPGLAAWWRHQDFSGGRLAASGRLDLPLPPPPAPPGLLPVGITGKITADHLPLRPPHHQDVWRLDAAVRLADGRVTVSPCRLVPASGEGAMDVSLVREPAADGVRSRLQADWHGVAIPALLRWALARPGEMVSGTTAGRLSLAWQGDRPERVRRSLTGEGRCRLAAGTLHLERWLGGLERYLGERRDLLAVGVDSLRGTLQVADGAVTVPRLVLDGPATDWEGNGRVGLDGSLDAQLRVRLPAGFTPGSGVVAAAAVLLRDADGRITLPLRVTGRLTAPRVAVNLKAPRGRLEQGIRGLLDKLRGNQ